MLLNAIYMIFANRLALQIYDMYSPGQFSDLSLVLSKKSWHSTTFCSSCKDLPNFCKFLHFITGAMKKEKSFHVPSVFFLDHVSRFFAIGGREATCENWKWILLYLTEVHQWEYLFFLEFSDQADLSVGNCCNICHCCICLFALMELKGLPDNIGLFAIKSISYIYTFQILVTKWVLRFKWRLLWLYFQTLSFSFSLMNRYERSSWKTWWANIF